MRRARSDGATRKRRSCRRGEERSSSTLVAVATISGCASAPPQPILTPIEVKVPVATPVYCQVAKLDKPALPISALKTDSAPDDTIRAYAATVAILKGAVRQRDLAIEGCAAPAGAQDATRTAGCAVERSGRGREMSAASLCGARRTGSRTGPAALGLAPPVSPGPISLGAERHRRAAGEGKRKAANFCRIPPEVGAELQHRATEAASPIGPSPGRHNFRQSEERKSRRPPSPRFIGRGCRRSSQPNPQPLPFREGEKKEAMRW